MDKQIKLATYTYPYEMDLVRTMLESEGIQCFTRDDNVSYAINSVVAGGIKLYVQDTDFKKALEIMASVHIEINDDSDIEASDIPVDDIQEDNNKINIQCPSCGSDNVRPHGLSEKILAASILILGIPIPIKKRTYFCFNCDTEFKLNK
jgi:hypothetical protein